LPSYYFIFFPAAFVVLLLPLGIFGFATGLAGVADLLLLIRNEN
jgi:hypothetical protein